MTQDLNQKATESRREFIVDIARWGAVGLVATTGCGLALRTLRATPEQLAACQAKEICGDCRQLTQCEKPQAIEYQRSMRKE